MKRLFLIIGLLPILLASSEYEEFDLIMAQIKKDISYSDAEVEKKKELFQEEYQTIAIPGIAKLRFSDLTIHEKIVGFPAEEEALIISTNSARVTGEWDYTKPHIYLIEKKPSGWEIVLKHEITSYSSALYSSCKTNEIGLYLCTDKSVQYFKPTEYGKDQPYVFQIFHMGSSASGWEILTIVYDWYGKKFMKSSDNLSFPVIPNPPMD
jgi:hypothetical protein